MFGVDLSYLASANFWIGCVEVMKLNKFVLFLSAAVILSNVTPVSPASAAIDGFYPCSQSGSFSVTGNGSIASSGSSCVGSADIPLGVSAIGTAAFANATSLTSVTIPNSVQLIGARAFNNAASLTSVTIPNSVTFLGDSAFRNLTSLKTLSIGSGITSITSNAFRGATSLTSVTIPTSVTSIGDYAFRGAISLPYLIIPNSVISIGTEAFYSNDSLTQVSIPASVTSIGARAFDSALGGVLEFAVFKGNAPTFGTTAFPNKTVLYYPCTATGYENLPYSTLPYSCPINLKVTFDSKGGSSVSDGSFYSGSSIQSAPSSTREGYTFAGWSATDGGNVVSFPYSPGANQDITLYALWSADSHKLTFNSKEGTAVSDGSFVSGGSIGAPVRFFENYTPPSQAGTIPLELGLRMSTTGSGWVKKVIFYKYIGDDSVHVAHVWSSDGTLLASQEFVNETASGWQIVTLDNPVYVEANQSFTVSVFGSNFIFGVKPFSQFANKSAGPLTIINGYYSNPVSEYPWITTGDNYAIDLEFDTTPSAPSRSGYTFLGWSATDGGAVVSFPYTPGVIEDITLYAVWSPLSHSATFDSKGGSSVDAIVFDKYGTATEPAEPTRQGYTFQGWSATDGGSVVSFPYSSSGTSDITFFAKWSINSYVVTFNSKGGTLTDSESLVFGSAIASSPKVPYRSGAVFVGWSATDGGTTISFPYAPSVASDVTLYAKWTLLAPLLSTASATTLLPGDLVTFKVSRVNSGCTVTVGWREANSGVSPVSKVARADRTTGVFTIATPSIVGRYTLSTNTIGSECSEGAAITLAKAFVVGKNASVVAKVSSSSAFVSKNPTISITGTVKSGGVVVASKEVTVSLRRNGVEVTTASATTNSSGVFTVSLPNGSYIAGDYTAVVTVVSDSTYRTSQVTTSKITLR
jgi:uncharacterized repeat protein (TIGR02543 family)